MTIRNIQSNITTAFAAETDALKELADMTIRNIQSNITTAFAAETDALEGHV